MTNRISVMKRALLLPNARMTCRAMLFVYSGYGNSIPGVSIVATSAPFPPSGPPPAAGWAGVFFDCAVVFDGLVGVACFEVFGVGLGVTCLGTGVGFAFGAGTVFFGSGGGVAAGGGGVSTTGGAGAGCCGRTTPIDR